MREALLVLWSASVVLAAVRVAVRAAFGAAAGVTGRDDGCELDYFVLDCGCVHR